MYPLEKLKSIRWKQPIFFFFFFFFYYLVIIIAQPQVKNHPRYYSRYCSSNKTLPACLNLLFGINLLDHKSQVTSYYYRRSSAVDYKYSVIP